MIRQDLLDELNGMFEEEYGHAIEEKDKVVDSGIDSFAMAMILSIIGDKYGIYEKEEFEKLDFANLTVKDVIDRILDANK